MVKRWSEAELRFLKDNVEKMSVQALADALSVRIDELEKKMEKLGMLGGAADAPAPKKATTLRELSKHTENARKDYDRGVAALQKKKLDEAERHFLDLIQKYPEERELVDRARVYLTVCERQRRDPRRTAATSWSRSSTSSAPPRRTAAAGWTSCSPAATRSRAIWAPRWRTSRRRSRKTSGTACSRATTGTSTRCGRRRSSRSCSLPRPDQGRRRLLLY